MKTYLLLPLISLALAPLGLTQVNLNVPRKAPVPVTDDTSKMPDGILKLNGMVYIIKGGVPLRIETDRFMRVTPDGTVTNFDGSTFAVPNGQLLGLDGSTIKVPGKLLDTRAVEQAMLPSSENGRNYSGLAPSTGNTTGVQGGNAATRGNTAGAGQIQSTGRSGTNRNRGNGNGNPGVDTVLDGTVPLASDANLTGPAGTNNGTGTTTGTAGTNNGTGTTNNGTPGANNVTGTTTGTLGTNNGTGTTAGTPGMTGTNAGTTRNSGFGTSTKTTNNPNATPTTSGSNTTGGTSGTSGTGGRTSGTGSSAGGTTRGTGGAGGSSGGSGASGGGGSASGGGTSGR